MRSSFECIRSTDVPEPIRTGDVGNVICPISDALDDVAANASFRYSFRSFTPGRLSNVATMWLNWPLFTLIDADNICELEITANTMLQLAAELEWETASVMPWSLPDTFCQTT